MGIDDIGDIDGIDDDELDELTQLDRESDDGFLHAICKWMEQPHTYVVNPQWMNDYKMVIELAKKAVEGSDSTYVLADSYEGNEYSYDSRIVTITGGDGLEIKDMKSFAKAAALADRVTIDTYGCHMSCIVAEEI